MVLEQSLAEIRRRVFTDLMREHRRAVEAGDAAGLRRLRNSLQRVAAAWDTPLCPGRLDREFEALCREMLE